MQTYSFSEEQIKKNKQRVFIFFFRLVGGITLAVLTFMAIDLWLRPLPFGENLDSFTLIKMALPWLLILLVPFWLAHGTAKALSLYKLTLNNNALVLQQANLPNIELRDSEIETIMEHPSTGLIVNGADNEKEISIPRELQGYEEIRGIIGKWKPVSPYQKKTESRMPVFIGVLASVPILILTYSLDPKLVLPSVAIVITGASYTVISLLKSESSSKTRTYVCILISLLMLLAALKGLKTLVPLLSK